MHGGQVSVSSAVDAVSTFRVELPLRPARPPVSRPPPRRSSRPPARRSRRRRAPARRDRTPTSSAAGRRGRARRCSSSTTTRTSATYLTRLLESDYAVRTAVDGAERARAARRAAARPGPDRRDDAGPRRLRAAAALREDPRTGRLPVIVLSARTGEEATVEGLDAGADDYLVKPFSAPSCSPASARTSRSRACATPSRRRRARAGARDGGRRAHAAAQPAAARAARRAGRRAVRALRPGERVARDRRRLLRRDGAGRRPRRHHDRRRRRARRARRRRHGPGPPGRARVRVRGAPAGRAHGSPRPLRVGLRPRDDHLPVRIFDPATGSLRFANAGHPPPLMRGATAPWSASRQRSATRSG